MDKKIVLLTGASSGIGKDAARTLLQRGWRVYGAARRTELMDDLIPLGGKVLKLDVTDDASCQDAVAAVLKAEGRIDALINNAGYGSFGSVENVSINEARRQFEVNVFGAARLMQMVIPSFKKQNSGRIINISSVVGKTSLPLMGWYCASKHALEALSDAARMELQQFGAFVSLVEPGVVESEFKDVAYGHLDGNQISADYTHIAKNMIAFQSKGTPAPASTVTKCLVHALESRIPKARYIPNPDSYWAQAARHWSPDGLYDAAVMAVLGRKK